MSLLEPNTIEAGHISFAEPGRVSSIHATPQLLERAVEALGPEGSIVLLVGDPGSGKSKIAQAAVDELGIHLGAEPATITLIAPSSPLATLATRFGVNSTIAPGSRGTFVMEVDGDHPDGAVEHSHRLLETVTEAAQSVSSGPVVVHVQGMDQYPQHLTMLVDAIVHVPGVRVVATARGLSGAAAHLAGNPRTQVVSVPPLTFEQSRDYLSRLLRVDDLELHTLRRWFRVAEGNRLSLMLLTLALDREGRIGRSRGIAYEKPGPDTVPPEFWNQLRDSCADEELRTLETIALAEPLGESVLIRRLDPTCLSALRSRGLLRSQYRAGAGAQLSLSHTLLAAGVRQQLSEDRVREISGELFDALRASTTTPQVYRQYSLLVRLVDLGLSAQRTLPVEWMHEALEAPAYAMTPAVRLRIAEAMLHHPEVSTTQLATAILHVVGIARTEGEHEVLDRAWSDVAEVLMRLRRSQAVNAMLRVRLELEMARHLALDLGDMAGALAVINDLERDLGDEASPERAAVQSERVVLLAAAGELQQARQHLPAEDCASSMPVEWELTGARVVSSLLLGQRGAFEAALCVADQTAAYALMGEKPQNELARILRFASFMTFWACGATEAARFTLEGMAEASKDVAGYVGYVETASALLSVADGKWLQAVQRTERIVDRLESSDPHRLARMVYAVHALGLAALGEKEASRRAIRAAEARSIGISQTLLGYVRLLTLRARQWNHDEGIAATASQLAGWARAEELEAIEFLALHVVAMEERGDARALLGRIRLLASEIEPPFSQSVLAHCEDLIAGVNSWESPAARALTSLGIWMPLTLTDELSAREREIALYASQGYSSRWIAEQFHLSVRTVDTHLRHVFTKLRVGGRDELRHWFRREHQPW